MVSVLCVCVNEELARATVRDLSLSAMTQQQKGAMKTSNRLTMITICRHNISIKPFNDKMSPVFQCFAVNVARFKVVDLFILSVCFVLFCFRIYLSSECVMACLHVNDNVLDLLVD